jgi:hypothetical protein
VLPTAEQQGEGLLGARSAAMIEHLMQSRLARGGLGKSCRSAISDAVEAGRGSSPRVARRDKAAANAAHSVKPVSLVQLRSGLLSRVANGRAIDVNCGVAAEVPVKIAEEAFERILVKLVCNASSQLVGHAVAGSPVGGGIEGEEQSATGISVGMLDDQVLESRPRPFQRVRLVGGDSGCGMTILQLDPLLCDSRKPVRASHEIGFRVVQQLMAASNGELRVMSDQGSGTRVQIDWPIAAIRATGTDAMGEGWRPDVAPLPNRLSNAIVSLTKSRRAENSSVDGQLEKIC